MPDKKYADVVPSSVHVKYKCPKTEEDTEVKITYASIHGPAEWFYGSIETEVRCPSCGGKHEMDLKDAI